MPGQTGGSNSANNQKDEQAEEQVMQCSKRLLQNPRYATLSEEAKVELTDKSLIAWLPASIREL